jgi:hypothetical protein
MPIDPMIARGVEPLTFGNTLMQISALKQRDRSLDQDAQYQNALMQDRQQARTDQQAMRTADDEEDAQWEAAIQAGDLDGAFRIDPQATSLYANWKKSQEPEKVPGPIEMQRMPDGTTFYLQDGISRGMRTPPAPQQGPQPSAEERDRAWYLNASEEQRALYDRMKGRNPEGAVNDGMNDRQRSGVNMQREAALNYAANVTKLGRDEINRIYQEGGPDAVAKTVNEKGKRPLQGWKARVAEGLPGGKMVVEAMNADLIGPRKAGGSGIAMMQNPTGPITTPDFQAGEAQFPGAVYPLPVQAEMIRQMLSTGGNETAAPQSGGREVDFSQLPPGR